MGAKFEIYTLMNGLVQQGMSIIMISSELPEVLGMSDRVYVVSAGRISRRAADRRSDTRKNHAAGNQLRRPNVTFFQDLQKVLRQNVREYGMYIALFVIMAIFTVLTNGLFLSSAQHQQPASIRRAISPCWRSA